MAAGLEQYGHGGDRQTAQERFGREADSFVDFSANINPLGPPPGVVEELKRALQEPGTPTLTAYPDPVCRRLTQVLAQWLGVSPEQVLPGNGAAELIDLIHTVAEPRVVGVIHPSFSEYEAAARKRKLEVIPLKTRWEKGFLPERESLLAWIREVDLAWIGHPNNPTGTRLPYEDLVAAAEEAARWDTVLAVDEAFLDFIPAEEATTLLPHLEAFPTTLLFRSMTKFYAIPGLRLGFVVASADWIEAMRRWQIPWSVNAWAQLAGVAALKKTGFEAETWAWLVEEKRYLTHQLRSLPGVEVLAGEANYLLLRLEKRAAMEGISSRWLQERLGAKGILIRDGSTYPGLDDRYLRVAIRSREENEQLLSALTPLLPAGGVPS
ncbi:MAG: threonine-phosphate decarboxylase CobD [Firmicutes bacterium]|mgnify:CR=1 FL=1|uniref:threonine-phosphate decarboxylase n=1 Tax=Melghirimyces thermohalophilus TaxID=1236220 RepID=A0A1G6KCV0_9BACL|nr:threonine-phosphate decarboxylase CobD [Melghirimyces thermohalophilus]MDA8352571.1 threonine-phosphate decarboxylase CobD [Bacillota bacterium]SDC28671.1 L-threonine O-3-phosphate decarboxylase [Melghirimyces thermohalophilus]